MGKVCFNAMMLDDKPTGLGIYSKNVLQGLIDNNYIDEIICNNKEWIEKNIKNINEIKLIQIKYNKNTKISRYIRNYKFNKFIKQEYSKKDVIIYSPTQHGINSNSIKQIITIHDVLPLIYPKGRIHQYIYYKYMLPKIIKQSWKIITISKNTRKDIIKNYNVNEEKIKVIYNGYDKPQKIDKEFSRKYILNKYKIENYLLMVGINYKYKNLHSVIKAYNEIKGVINNKLVIVGNYKVKYGEELKNLVKKLNLQDKVIFLGYIDQKDKNMIYQASKLFIYPSLYEGFGLPPLEAMANGVPVMCSKGSSLSEVVGNSAITFSPNNIHEIKGSIIRVLQDEKLNYEYIRRGFNNIKKFDWKYTCNEILNLMK